MTVRKIFAGGSEITEYEEELARFKRDKPELPDENNLKSAINKTYADFDKNLALMILLENAVLCNDAYYIDEKSDKMIGDPTETALIEMGRIFNFSKPYCELKMPRKIEEPFDSIRKIMTTVHEIHKDSFAYQLDFIKDRIKPGASEEDNGYLIFVKGAPEEILKKCTYIIKNLSLIHI